MLTPEQFKELNRLNPLRSLGDIAVCWATIGGCLYLTHLSLYFLPIAVPIITTRLHALTVMMHDGAHYLILKNRFLNDVVSNLFCSFPVMISTDAYRKTHHNHHRYTQTLRDPNYVTMTSEDPWKFPKPTQEVKKLLLRDLLLLTMKDHMLILKDWQVLPNFKKIPNLEKVLFPLYLVGVLSAVWVLNLWVEFGILQVSSLFINPIVRIRAMSEHVHHESHGSSIVDKLKETPTVNAIFLERFFISPFNTNRHLEHHIYPTIPYYNLEKAHKLIKETELYKTHCAYELDGYFIGWRTSFNEVLCDDSNSEKKEILKAA